MSNEKDYYRIKRLKKKITLTEIAKEISCAISTLSRYENEQDYFMSYDKVEKYKEYLNNH